MTTTRRRRYRFKTRGDAEDKVLSLEIEAVHLHRAMRAIYTEIIEWFPNKHPYRVGLFDTNSASGSRVIVIFNPGGQEVSIGVHDAYEWSTRAIRSTHAIKDFGTSTLNVADEAFVYLARQVRETID